eukprot:TRINITY_DN111716_c0_g1_i1.p1 TRINITY_DN111716_c0_g1~~TRINITY_DN111716_c0_g1_i1.p1  ORF type:complete len:324 (-),score=57.14 TRINITY_DN111716_c0_g1_i1:96-1067(-)
MGVLDRPTLIWPSGSLEGSQRTAGRVRSSSAGRRHQFQWTLLLAVALVSSVGRLDADSLGYTLHANRHASTHSGSRWTGHRTWRSDLQLGSRRCRGRPLAAAAASSGEMDEKQLKLILHGDFEDLKKAIADPELGPKLKEMGKRAGFAMQMRLSLAEKEAGVVSEEVESAAPRKPFGSRRGLDPLMAAAAPVAPAGPDGPSSQARAAEAELRQALTAFKNIDSNAMYGPMRDLFVKKLREATAAGVADDVIESVRNEANDNMQTLRVRLGQAHADDGSVEYTASGANYDPSKRGQVPFSSLPGEQRPRPGASGGADYDIYGPR